MAHDGPVEKGYLDPDDPQHLSAVEMVDVRGKKGFVLKHTEPHQAVMRRRPEGFRMYQGGREKEIRKKERKSKKRRYDDIGS